MSYERKAYIDISKDLLSAVLRLPSGCKVDKVYDEGENFFSIIVKWNPIVCLDMPEVEEGECPQIQVGYKKIEAVTLVELNLVDNE